MSDSAIAEGATVPAGNEPAVEEVTQPPVEAKEPEVTPEVVEGTVGDAEDPEKKAEEKKLHGADALRKRVLKRG